MQLLNRWMDPEILNQANEVLEKVQDMIEKDADAKEKASKLDEGLAEDAEMGTDPDDVQQIDKMELEMEFDDYAQLENVEAFSEKMVEIDLDTYGE